MRGSIWPRLQAALRWPGTLVSRWREWRTEYWQRRLGIESHGRQMAAHLQAFLDPYQTRLSALEGWQKRIRHHLCEEDQFNRVNTLLEQHAARILAFEAEIGKFRHHFCERDRIAEIERELLLFRWHLCDAVVREPLRTSLQQWRGLAERSKAIEPVLMAYQMKLQVKADADE